jgi:hypothetical protein
LYYVGEGLRNHLKNANLTPMPTHTTQPWPTTSELAGAVILLSLMVPLGWHWLYFKGEVPVNGNVLREVYPNWRVTHDQLNDGRWPLWNPYKDMGEPYLADPKSLAAYPLSWALTEVSSFSNFLKGWFLFHTILAAFFAGTLSLRWFRSTPAALISASMAAFNGFFMAHGPYINLFASAAWLPAVWYFHSRGSWRLLGTCVALQWLAGYPPFSLLTIMGLFVLTGGLKEGSWSCLATGVLTAAALAAYQWVPFLELMTHAVRGLFLNPGMVLPFSILPKDLLKELCWPQWIWMSPEIYGDPAVIGFYFGGLALPLAAWAAWRGGRREHILVLSAATAFLLCLGAAIPGYGAFHLLRLFRFPATWLLLAAGFMTLLAGAGISKIRNQRTAWILAGVMTIDLLLFAQRPTCAWLQPGYLEQPPALAYSLTHGPQPSRLYHSPAMDSAWLNLELRTIDDYRRIKQWMAASSGAGWGVREADSYQVLRLNSAQKYLDRLAREGPQSPLLSWAGISTVITRKEGAARLEDSFIALTLPSAKPPLFFADDRAAGRITPVTYDPGRVRAHIVLEKPAVLVLSEVDYPGWRARMDGRPVKHSRFADTFLAVPVPAGRHEVRWDYEPLSFQFGLAISLLALIGLAISLFPRNRPNE